MDKTGTPNIIPFDEAKLMVSSQSMRTAAIRRDRLASYIPKEGVAVGQGAACSANVGSMAGGISGAPRSGFSSYDSVSSGAGARVRSGARSVRLASPARSTYRLDPADDIFDDPRDFSDDGDGSVVRSVGGPRAALEMYDPSSRDSSDNGGSRSEGRRKARVKQRAERMFMKQFGSDDVETSSSRAALYKGEMGRKHKRAFDDLEKARRVRSSSVARARSHSVSIAVPKIGIAISVVLAVFVMLLFLYPTAQQFYVESREQSRLQAEYDALSERNAFMENRIAYLKTEEGIKDTARSELGWVEEGETAGVVRGIAEADAASEGLYAQVRNGSVPAPVTWYSPMLDAFFGYVDPATAFAENTDMTNLRDVASDEAKDGAPVDSAS